MHALERCRKLTGGLAAEHAFNVQNDFLHRFDEVGGFPLKRFDLLGDLRSDVVFDVVEQRVSRQGQGGGVTPVNANGFGSKQVRTVNHGHGIRGEKEIGVFDPKFHQQFSLSSFHKLDSPHLTHLVAVDQDGVAHGQARHIVVHGVVGVAPSEGVEAFEVVDPQHQKHNARDDEHTDFEF